MKFKKGDRVYHKNLKAYGVFEDYDWADNSSCFVTLHAKDSKLMINVKK